MFTLLKILIIIFAIIGFVFSGILASMAIDEKWLKRPPNKKVRQILKQLKANPNDWKFVRCDDFHGGSYFDKDGLRLYKTGIAVYEGTEKKAAFNFTDPNTKAYVERFFDEQDKTSASFILDQKMKSIFSKKNEVKQELALSKRDAKKIEGLGEL